MAKTGILNVTANNTFQVWLDRTNELVDLMETDVITASVGGDNTGTVGTPKTANLYGTFSANTIIANTRLRADTFDDISGSGITIEAPVTVDTSTSVGLEVFSSSTDPVIRVYNNTVSWDIGFDGDSQSFIINNGSVTDRLRLTTAGNLAVTGSITAGTGGFIGNVTGNLTGNLTGDVIGNVTGNLTGNAATATKLATSRTVTLSGAVTGSASFDGSSNITISTTATSDPTLTIDGDASGSATFTNLGNATLTLTVADDSHNHIISNVDGLQTALDGKASNSTQLTATWETGTSTTETIVSPAKVKAAIEAFAPDWLFANQVITSGGETAIDFTGIPEGINSLWIWLESLDAGSDRILIQFGNPFEGYKSSDYITGSGWYFGNASGGGGISSSASGFLLNNTYTGDPILSYTIWRRHNQPLNIWSGGGPFAASRGMGDVVGSIDLNGPLTQVRITRSGSSSFLAGGKVAVGWSY